MKNTLLLFALAFAHMQSLHSQTTQDLLGVGTSIFGSSKKQKKKDREQFVIDSTNNVIIAKKKRDLFVKDSLLNVENLNRQKEEIKAKELAEKKKQEWSYDHYKENPYSFTFSKTIISYFLTENINSPRLSMDTFSDSTATTKIGSLKLIEILSTDIFDVLANNHYNRLYLIKSRKGNKICVIEEDVMYYQNWGKGNGARLTTEYHDPQKLAKEKLILDSYRLKLKNALSTVSKLEAINNKHLVNMVNAFGVVVEQKYDPTKFSKEEKNTYKQLIQKLKLQRDEINTELDKKIDSKKKLTALIDVPDISKQMEIEHAYLDYSATASGF